jgi:hypothetical protein
MAGLYGVVLLCLVLGGHMYGLAPAQWVTQYFFGEHLQLMGNTRPEMDKGDSRKMTAAEFFLSPLMGIPATFGIWTRWTSRGFRIGPRQDWYEAKQENGGPSGNLVSWKSMYEATAGVIALAWQCAPCGALMSKGTQYLNTHIVLAFGMDGGGTEEPEKSISEHLTESDTFSRVMQLINWAVMILQFFLLCAIEFDMFGKDPESMIRGAGICLLIIFFTTTYRVSAGLAEEFLNFDTQAVVAKQLTGLVESGAIEMVAASKPHSDSRYGASLFTLIHNGPSAAFACGAFGDVPEAETPDLNDAPGRVLLQLRELTFSQRKKVIRAARELLQLTWVLQREFPEEERTNIAAFMQKSQYYKKAKRCVKMVKEYDQDITDTMNELLGLNEALDSKTPCFKASQNKSFIVDDESQGGFMCPDLMALLLLREAVDVQVQALAASREATLQAQQVLSCEKESQLQKFGSWAQDKVKKMLEAETMKQLKEAADKQFLGATEHTIARSEGHARMKWTASTGCYAMYVPKWSEGDKYLCDPIDARTFLTVSGEVSVSAKLEVHYAVPEARGNAVVASHQAESDVTLARISCSSSPEIKRSDAARESALACSSSPGLQDEESFGFAKSTLTMSSIRVPEEEGKGVLTKFCGFCPCAREVIMNAAPIDLEYQLDKSWELESMGVAWKTTHVDSAKEGPDWQHDKDVAQEQVDACDGYAFVWSTMEDIQSDVTQVKKEEAPETCERLAALGECSVRSGRSVGTILRTPKSGRSSILPKLTRSSAKIAAVDDEDEENMRAPPKQNIVFSNAEAQENDTLLPNLLNLLSRVSSQKMEQKSKAIHQVNQAFPISTLYNLCEFKPQPTIRYRGPDSSPVFIPTEIEKAEDVVLDLEAQLENQSEASAEHISVLPVSKMLSHAPLQSSEAVDEKSRSDVESESEGMVLDTQMQENQPEARTAHNSELGTLVEEEFAEEQIDETCTQAEEDEFAASPGHVTETFEEEEEQPPLTIAISLTLLDVAGSAAREERAQEDIQERAGAEELQQRFENDPTERSRAPVEAAVAKEAAEDATQTQVQEIQQLKAMIKAVAETQAASEGEKEHLQALVEQQRKFIDWQAAELQKKEEEFKAALEIERLRAEGEQQRKLIEGHAVELQKMEQKLKAALERKLQNMEQELKVSLEREQVQRQAEAEQQHKLIEEQAMELQKKEEELKAASEVAEQQKACAYSVEPSAAEHKEPSAAEHNETVTVNQLEQELKKYKAEAALAKRQQLLLARSWRGVRPGHAQAQTQP